MCTPFQTFNNWLTTTVTGPAANVQPGGGHMPPSLAARAAFNQLQADEPVGPPTTAIAPSIASGTVVSSPQDNTKCPDCQGILYYNSVPCYSIYCDKKICLFCYEKRREFSDNQSMEYAFYCSGHGGRTLADMTPVVIPKIIPKQHPPIAQSTESPALKIQDNTSFESDKKPTCEFSGKKKKKKTKDLNDSVKNNYAGNTTNIYRKPQGSSVITLKKTCTWCNRPIAVDCNAPITHPRKCKTYNCMDLICGDCRAPTVTNISGILHCYLHEN
jgi:hypothetical protein